jgi:hypothetical protein
MLPAKSLTINICCRVADFSYLLILPFLPFFAAIQWFDSAPPCLESRQKAFVPPVFVLVISAPAYFQLSQFQLYV